LFISKLIDIVIAAGAVQGFFLALIHTTGTNRNKASNKILSVLLVVLSVSILHSLLAPQAFHSPYKIMEPFILLIGPLLTFYVFDLTGIRKHTFKDALHGIPFVLLILFILPVWTSKESPYTEYLFAHGLAISKIIWTLIVLQYGYYWWNILSVFKRHRLAIESEFSDLEGKTLTWLHVFLHVFGGFLLLLVLTLFIAFHTDYYERIGAIICFGISIVIFVLGYFGLRQDEIRPPATSLSELQQEESIQVHPPDKSIAEKAKPNDELLQKLQSHLKTAKPYLNESLTLTELARQIGTTRNQLSFLINSAYGENFYTFVNKFRVEEVKQLITNPKNKNFTILSLAFEAGFPSKSSFHTIFKKFTGITPAEYRSKLP
jgi:AraC-like DNA-binding protein